MRVVVIGASRVLLSCRDPNGAHQVRELLRVGGPLEFTVVADEPAYSMLRADGCDVRMAAVETVLAGDAASVKQRAVARAAELLREIRPNAIISSSSGPGAGIDEALVAAAKPGYRYVMQDFWGDVNETLGVLADCYFVLDAEATTLTRRRTSARICETGMPKFGAYGGLDFERLRSETRAKLNAGADVRVVSLFTQPLWDTACYSETMQAVVDAAKALAGETCLVIRAHPSDRGGRIEALSHQAEASGLRSTAASGIDTNAVIAASDMVCSAFSSCCYDAAVMASRSSVPLGVPIYVMPEGVRKTFESYSGIDMVPPVKAGLALMARNRSELGELFERVAQPETRRDVWQRCRAQSTMASNPANRIISIVRDDIGNLAA